MSNARNRRRLCVLETFFVALSACEDELYLRTNMKTESFEIAKVTIFFFFLSVEQHSY